MIPHTTGREFSPGKIVPVQCVTNDKLDDIDIKDCCFLLIIIHNGSAIFQVDNILFEAIAPCYVCFDERAQPNLIKKQNLRCDSIYFHPTFLNVNMSFRNIHQNNYTQLALAHDMFLLKPFTDNKNFVFPILEEYTETLNRLFVKMDAELKNQNDWYWSCRSRSFFMELMLMLEQAYGITGQSLPDLYPDKLKNPHLKKAVIYIQSHYQENITLDALAKSASMSHTALTKLFKSELNTTPIEYLWKHRISVAKKHLEFTSLPIKDISARCGFKTVPHFCRKFEAHYKKSPSEYRIHAVAKRKASF